MEDGSEEHEEEDNGGKFVDDKCRAMQLASLQAMVHSGKPL